MREAVVVYTERVPFLRGNYGPATSYDCYPAPGKHITSTNQHCSNYKRPRKFRLIHSIGGPKILKSRSCHQQTAHIRTRRLHNFSKPDLQYLWNLCKYWEFYSSNGQYSHRELIYNRAFWFRKNILIWFSEMNWFLLIRFNTSQPYRRIGYYRLLCCQMSTLLRHHESLSQLHKDVGCDVSYNNWAERCYIK